MPINNKTSKQKTKTRQKSNVICHENVLINEVINQPYIKTRFSVNEGFETKDFKRLLKLLLSQKKIKSAKQLIVVDIRKSEHESYVPVVEMHGAPIDPHPQLTAELNKIGAISKKYNFVEELNFIALLNSTFKSTQEIVTKAGAIYFKPTMQNQSITGHHISPVEELISSIDLKDSPWIHFLV